MNNILPTVQYFILTVKHKWFVFLAGIKVGVPLWRLIIHDLSKFSWQELPNYGRQFFGDRSDPEGFIRTWIHHQNRNDHHWEYWVPRTGHNRCTPPFPDGEPVRMPLGAAREMVADWFGASRAYEGTWPDNTNWPWLRDHWNNIKTRIHPETEQVLISALLAAGIEVTKETQNDS